MISSLFSTEDLFISLFESSPVYIWIKDTKNNLININQAAATLEGKPAVELEGKSCFDLYPRESAEAFWKDDLEVVRTGLPKLGYYELHIPPGSNNEKWLQVNKIPVKNTEGEIYGVMVYAIDITDLKRIEELSRERELKNKQLIDSAPFPVLITSLEQNKFMYLNHAAVRFLNLTPDAAITAQPEKIYLDKDTRARFKERLLKEGSIENQEISYTSRSGEIVYGIVSAVLIEYEGKPCSYLIFNNISKLKKNEIKVSQIAEEFRLVFENSSDALFWADSKSGIIINCNHRAEELLELDRNLIIGKHHWEIHPFQDKEKYQKLFAGIEKTNPEGMELEVVNASGKIIPVSISVATTNTESRCIVQATIRDISERIANEKALKESESKFRLMAENMKDVIWQLSGEMIFTYLSPSFYQLSGYEPYEFIGKTLWDLVTEETSRKIQEVIQKHRSSPGSGVLGSFTFEASQYCKNGKLIWTEIGTNPIYDDSGKLLYFQGVTRDITQRKIAELELKENKEKLSAVIANAPIVLFQIDKDGIFRFSDGKGLESLGQNPGEAVGLSVFDVYKDYPLICAQLKSALQGVVIQDITEVNGLVFETQYNPVKNQMGEVTSVIGIALDITERKNMENALLESEQRFSTLFHEMTEGVALHDLVYDDQGTPVNYKIREVNPSYAKQTGLIASEAKNKLATEYYRTSYPPYFEEFLSAALTGNKFTFETFFEPLEKYFKISVFSSGKSSFATVFEDVTIQILREKELRDKNEELERFTYTVSHDLKSPLVTIKGFIGMLEQDLVQQNKEHIIDDMQRIKSATDKMTSLLNDLLELSRVGRIINPPVKISMGVIINEALELVSGILKQRGVEVEIGSVLPYVYVDKQRLTEVWQNLIENAVKFMGEQQNPKISINYFKEDAKFIFFIQDNGIGIDKKYHQTIFGLFNKLDNKSDGTGIGLALVKRIIEVHGGELWIESDGVGKGTKFFFSIPVKEIKR